jgi:hypothetical protein
MPVLQTQNPGRREAAARLGLSLDRLGLGGRGLAARDALTHESLSLDGNVLQLGLKPMRMRLVLIQ